MAKRKNKTKRSLGSLPKGLPQRPGNKRSLEENPFEVSSRNNNKRSKHQVHNRNTTNNSNNTKQSALQRSLERRKLQLKESLETSKKTNAFVDRRIGEYNPTLTADHKMLARLVKERSRRSKRSQKYSLEDDNINDQQHTLTHKGRVLTDFDGKEHVMLSDSDEDDDDKGNLDALDTQLHFGGFRKEASAYGPADGGGGQDLVNVYSQRKTELDEMIHRRKVLKAERLHHKEQQVEAFESMDDGFQEIASLLQFRDKQKERKAREEARREGTMSDEEQEMAEWDKEMKTFLLDRKVKATDRTKTPEEIAKEEADRLHELEMRRLARMNGDFDEDDFSDISDDDGKKGRKKKKKTGKARNPDELDDSDEEGNNNDMDVRFTADGLIYVDKNGVAVKKVGDEEHSNQSDSSDSDRDGDDEGDDASEDHHDSHVVLTVGARVCGSYRVKEQFQQQGSWYEGVITKVNKQLDGQVTYDVTYDDGDVEEAMDPANVRLVKKTQDDQAKETSKQHGELAIKRKQQKAKDKARQEIPFVFEVPTTLEALHDMIGNYASTGEDASLIIERIHKANSVRLNRNNLERMQNFYDVLLRRFVAVGDAIYSSGDGGPTLGRYKQLDSLTKTLYAISQDSPECAGAVWGRRLGIFQNAHAKRLRDAEFVSDDNDDDDEEEQSAWPSTGTILLLRAVGHIFPVTDHRHPVVTPALLLLGQFVAQTPVRSVKDAVMGIMCAGLMIDFTKDAKRVTPEALSFLAGMLRLFSVKPDHFPIPSLEAAAELPEFASFRKRVSEMEVPELPRLSLQKDDIENKETPVALLCSALQLVDAVASHLGGSLHDGETEAFAEITKSLLAIKPRSKVLPLSPVIASRVGKVASIVASKLKTSRKPLMRRVGPSVQERAIRSLAPRMEDPTRYSLSKDKGKSSVQAAIDRTRREYKREHKAVARELRLDAAFIENERRIAQDKKDAKSRDKRTKNFAWMEEQQASMNQQVRQGGGLLSGGGMGAAKAKARSGKLGIKKGGKF